MYILQSELKIWYFLQIAKNLRFKAVIFYLHGKVLRMYNYTQCE